jgi:hypothetical protein
MTKQDPYWFFKKWGFSDSIPADDIYDRLIQLEDRVKVLEEENIGLTNALYEMENALEARIDILTGELWLKKDV